MTTGTQTRHQKHRSTDLAGRHPPKTRIYYYEVAFGHTDKEGKPVPEELITQATHLFKAVFVAYSGGGQVLKQQGFFADAQNEVQDEHSTTIRSFCQRQPLLHDQIHATAQQVAHLLHQDSVLVVTGALGHGTLNFITPSAITVPQLVKVA